MDSATAGSSLPKSLLADRLTEARIAWHLRCALRLVEKSERACLVSASLSTPVRLEPQIITQRAVADPVRDPLGARDVAS
jgi:hypothetical protein